MTAGIFAAGLFFTHDGSAATIAKIARVLDLNKIEVSDYPTPLVELLSRAGVAGTGERVRRNTLIEDGDSVLTRRANTHVEMNRNDREVFLYSETLVAFDALDVWAIEQGAMFIVNPRGRLEILKRGVARILANSSLYVEVTSDGGLLVYVFDGVVTISSALGVLQLAASETGRVSGQAAVQQVNLSGADESRILAEIDGARTVMGSGGGGGGGVKAVAIAGAVVGAGGAGYLVLKEQGVLDGDVTTSTTTTTTTIAPVRSADLEITKRVVGRPTAGDDFSYDIGITNHGPDDATDVVMTDTLPNELVFQSGRAAADFPGASCMIQGRSVTCRIGALRAGQTSRGTLDVTARGAGVITNTAEVSGAENDPNRSNNRATATTAVDVPIPLADLELENSAEPKQAAAGQSFTFTMVVTNNGPDSSSGLQLVATLSHSAGGRIDFDDLDPVSDTSPEVSCTRNASEVRCTSSDFDGDGSVLEEGDSFQVEITVSSLDRGTVTNNAVVTGDDEDRVRSNNSERFSVSVVPRSVDLEVDNRADSTSVGTGESFTFTVRITNNGRDPSSGLTLVNTLSHSDFGRIEFDPVTPFSDTGREVRCAMIRTLIQCEASDSDGDGQVLAPRESFEVRITLSSPDVGTVTNSAVVTGVDGDPFARNNSERFSVSVLPVVLASLDTAFTSTLEAPPGGARGKVSLDGTRVDSTAAAQPFRHQFRGQSGIHRVEAQLVSAAETEVTWRFVFTDAPGFVPGSIRLEHGELVGVAGRSVTFRLSGAPGQRVSFTYRLRF